MPVDVNSNNEDTSLLHCGIDMAVKQSTGSVDPLIKLLIQALIVVIPL